MMNTVQQQSQPIQQSQTTQEPNLDKIFENLKSNPEKALNVLKSEELELNHTLKTLESEKEKIIQQAIEGNQTELIQILSKIDETSTDTELSVLQRNTSKRTRDTK